jgi:hypothetical protein
METKLRVGAVLAALSWLGPVVAQEATGQSPDQSSAQAPVGMEARLAAAKLAETSGDLVGAERVLREGLTAESVVDRTRASKALHRFLLRVGRMEEARAFAPGAEQRGAEGQGAEGQGAQEPQAPQGGEDPIQRLIAVLDTGAATNTSVKDAAAQLATLGALVVPNLLAALPKLGPFGKNNVLDLVGQYDDSRVGDTLAGMLEGGDPGLVSAIVGRMQKMKRGVVLSLAQKVATGKFDSRALAAALYAVLRVDSSSPFVEELARNLATSHGEAGQKSVVQLLGDTRAPWAVGLLAEIMRNGPVSYRGSATRLWILSQPDLTEAKALAALAELGPEDLVSVCQQLREDRKEWVHVALLQLETVRKMAKFEGETGGLVESWEWWREREDSGRALLALPWNSQAGARAVYQALAALEPRGWRVPAGMEGAWVRVWTGAGYGSGASAQLVQLLPMDAEDRLLALWPDFSGTSRFFLCQGTLSEERPWHRVVARSLASAERSADVDERAFERDWRGAPESAIADLTSLVRRWPTALDGRHVKWHTSYVNVYARTPELPASMILPLVEVGNGEAFAAWVRRDPNAALEFARKSAKLTPALVRGVTELLWRQGGVEDVALGLRLESMLREPGLVATQQVFEFLKRVGGGTLGVIQLAALPMPRGANSTMRLETARAAAAGAKVADLHVLLSFLPALQADCAAELCKALERQIRPEHAGLLIAAIEARLANPMPMVTDSNSRTWGDGPILQWLVQQLGTTQDPKALPALRKVLGMPDPQSYVLVQAANAMLQCAGSSRRQLLVDMLSSSQVEVATAALAAEELRSDAELRDVARTALLRIGDRIEDAQSTFAVLDEADRVGLASAVVKAPNFARFSQQLAMVAIDVLGAQKSAAQVEPIWAGYRHPDEFVRQHAAIALGSTFSREAAPHLIEMLKDDSSDVRTAAQKALDEIANYLDAKAKWEARLK